MATSKPEAKNLPCIFATFIDKYPESQLVQCENKEKQRWRHASAEAAVSKITILAEYFPELNLLLDSLEDYSLCEKHYNQVINSFINKLQRDELDFKVESKGKRLKLSSGNELPAFRDFKVQVSLPDPECQKLLTKIDELEYCNEQLLSENEILKKKLNSRFDSQQDRIEAITDIDKKERNNLYNDIVNIMEDHTRFHLDNLLKYSPSQWLAKQNPVVVKFIEHLTYNENENQHEGKNYSNVL